VRNNRGELIPLSQLVKMEETRGMIEVSRPHGRERAISVFAKSKPGSRNKKRWQAVEDTAKKGSATGLSSGSAGARRPSPKVS